MHESGHRGPTSLRRWEAWLRAWIAPSDLQRAEEHTGEVAWLLRFDDGSSAEVRIGPSAVHGDETTFQKITDRLDGSHWMEVIRREGGIRIHENGWIEKIG